MMKLKYTVIVVVSLCFGTLATPGVSNQKQFVAMSLNESLANLSKINPALSKYKSDQSDGIRTIKGPVDFKFRYGGTESLQFNDVKLVIFKAADARIKYIHVFPQMKNLSTTNLSKFIAKLESELIGSKWEKQPEVKSTNTRFLHDAGIHEYARYQFSVKSEPGKFKSYELVFTTFIDANVHCHDDKDSTAASSKCNNRFLRLGFNNV